MSYIVECGDDASIFFDRDAYQDFYCDIDEYTGKVNLYGVPDNLKEFFEELKEQYEDEHTVYEDEEIEMY